MTNKRKISIEHFTDTYEFTLHDSKITHVIKFIGDTGASRDLLYEQVPYQVKEKLHDELD